MVAPQLCQSGMFPHGLDPLCQSFDPKVFCHGEDCIYNLLLVRTPVSPRDERAVYFDPAHAELMDSPDRSMPCSKIIKIDSAAELL